MPQRPFGLDDLGWSMGLGCIGGVGSFVWSKAVGSPITITIAGSPSELAAFMCALVLGSVVAGITCSASGFSRRADAGRFFSAALLAGLLWKPTAEMLEARIKNQPDFQAERQGQIASRLATDGAPLAAVQKAALETLEVLPRTSADTQAEVTEDVKRTVKAIETGAAPPQEKAESLALIVEGARRADSPELQMSAAQAINRVAIEPALRQKYDGILAGILPAR
jgi:hypothetical protein